MPPRPTDDSSDEGPQSNRGKLSPEQRLAIAKRIEAGEKQTVLAEEFGVTRQAISLLMKKYREEGEDVIKEGRRGRKPSRRLSPDEEQAVHQIITSHKTPKGAGLAPTEKGKNKWDADSVKRLVARECSFTPTKSIVADLLSKWGLTPKRERQFSQDYYDYINSEVGKQVSRRNWELRDQQLRERREAAAAERAAGAEEGGAGAPADGGDDEIEMMEYTAEELAQIRRQMLANRQLPGGAGQRSGKHRKGRGAQTPSRKKRRKKRRK